MALQEGPGAPPILEGVQDPQAPLALQAPLVLQAPQQPIPHMLQLNWSHFQSEFSGKPDKDAEAHLLRTKDWMDTHRF